MEWDDWKLYSSRLVSLFKEVVMIGDEKEVYFDQYCPNCKNKDVDEHDPNGECWDCLESPTNVDSHKPINFKEAK